MSKTEELGLFDRVSWPKGASHSEVCHGIGRFAEWYFDMGQKRYAVLKSEWGNVIPLQPIDKKKATLGNVIAMVVVCFIKVLTYLTIAIPIVVFVAKLIYRTSNDFEIFKNGIPQPDQYAKLKDVLIDTEENNKIYIVPPAQPKPVEPLKTVTQPTKKQHNRIVERYVNENFTEESVTERISLLTQRIDQFDIKGKINFSALYRLYVDLISQELNLRLITEHHGTFLDPLELDYITNARHYIARLVESLSSKVKENPAVLKQFQKLEDEVKNTFQQFEEKHVNKIPHELCDRYMRAANVLEKLLNAANAPAKKTYDQTIYSKIEQKLKPMPIENFGNTCYLNSALQCILAASHLKDLFCGTWKAQTLSRFPDESEKNYQSRLKTHQQAFSSQSNRWKQIRQHFISVATAFESRDQRNLDRAVRALNQAFANAKCFDGRIGQQHDAIQPIQTLLMAIDYALEMGVKVRYTPNTIEGIEKIKDRRNERTQMIRLIMKEHLEDHPYATSFQALLNHQFNELEMNENTKVDDDPVSVRYETTKIQKIEDYLAVELVRTGQSIKKIKDRIIEGKHLDEIKFTEGEIIDFTSAYQPGLVADGEKILYEVVATARHHGMSNRGGHWTANVKCGGKWYVCDDKNPVRSIGLANPFLGTGSVYLFKRVLY